MSYFNMKSTVKIVSIIIMLTATLLHALYCPEHILTDLILNNLTRQLLALATNEETGWNRLSDLSGQGLMASKGSGFEPKSA